MKVFVAGATGFIGRAVCLELKKRGHAVQGLARTPEKAKALGALGVTPVPGDLRAPGPDWDGDCVIHAAAEYSADYRPLDEKAARWLAERAAKGRRAVYTSGVWLYGNTGPKAADENADVSKSHIAWRAGHEKLVTDSGGVVLRPGCVYGGAGSLTAEWFAAEAPVSGDGKNRWATVELGDLAVLYALAAESSARGEIFNGTDGSTATYGELAEAAAKEAGGKVLNLGPDAAAKRWGPMAQALAFDQAVDSGKARKTLGWAPKHAGFVPGAASHYASWKSYTAAQLK